MGFGPGGSRQGDPVGGGWNWHRRERGRAGVPADAGHHVPGGVRGELDGRPGRVHLDTAGVLEAVRRVQRSRFHPLPRVDRPAADQRPGGGRPEVARRVHRQHHRRPHEEGEEEPEGRCRYGYGG